VQRSLREEATSYRDLVDAVRRDLALAHLTRPGTSAADVAFLLGSPSRVRSRGRSGAGQALHRHASGRREGRWTDAAIDLLAGHGMTVG